MSNFSQSISSSFKCSKQKSQVPLPLCFKITPPKSNKCSRATTTQQSINLCSDTTSSITHKNMSKSYSKQRLEDQYISFKLKPTKNQDKTNPVRIIKEKLANEIETKQQAENFYFANFQESRDYQKKNSMSELTKSPQFFCKPNSEDSIKESFAEQKQKQSKLHNFKKAFYDENSFCKLMNNSQEFQALKKYEKSSKAIQIIQNKANQKQIKLNIEFDDSVIYDNFENFEIFTPYKELKEEFQRQQKIYEKQMRINSLKQFDSFSQKSSETSKPNSFHGKAKNHITYRQMHQQQHINQMIEDPKIRRIKQTLQSTEKKSFFFLTNPSIQQPKKPFISKKNPQNTAHLQNKEDKNIQEFCFSLSSIKMATEGSIEQPYNPQNLFSNSKDQLLFFDSKSCQKNFGSFGGGSKKVHIRQLVEEFVDQLENLDEKSLNEKNVHELEGVLESIVFKESKNKRQPIYIQEDLPIVGSRTRSPVIEEQTKKWQKIKRDNSSDIATERKPLSQFQNFGHKFSPHKRQNHYAFTISSSQKKPLDGHYEKIPHSGNFSIGKQNIKKQSVYKPNFGMCRSRQKIQSKEKENLRVCTSFTNLKQKKQTATMNINEKSSVYVNKGTKSSRQHLRTDSSYNPSRLKIY